MSEAHSKDRTVHSCGDCERRVNDLLDSRSNLGQNSSLQEWVKGCQQCQEMLASYSVFGELGFGESTIAPLDFAEADAAVNLPDRSGTRTADIAWSGPVVTAGLAIGFC